MDLIERRAYLNATPNPDKKLDYIITVKGHSPKCAGEACLMSLRYIPDRSVLDTSAFGQYLEACATVNWNTPEDFAVTVLGDVNDKIIPRWIQVTLDVSKPQHPCVDRHAVVLEDRQPGWDNAHLLGRMVRI